jgi:hypothetical protein
MCVCMYVCRRINQTEDRFDGSHSTRSRKQKVTEIKGRYLRIVRANTLHFYLRNKYQNKSFVMLSYFLTYVSSQIT